jgi:hypothetical protein
MPRYCHDPVISFLLFSCSNFLLPLRFFVRSFYACLYFSLAYWARVRLKVSFQSYAFGAWPFFTCLYLRFCFLWWLERIWHEEWVGGG